MLKNVCSKLVLLLLIMAGSNFCSAQDATDPGDAGSITLDAASDTPATPQSPFPPEVTAAIEKFKTRDFKGAEAMLKEAVAANPKLPPAGVLMGTLYFRANQPNAARAAFEQAVRDNPEDPEAYVVFGENALQQRRITDAILLFEKANSVASAYSNNADRKKNMVIRSLNGMAAVSEARGNYDAAETALNKVLSTDPVNVNAMTRLGRVLFSKGTKADEQKAYETFKKLYEIDPMKMTRYEINMARLYQGKGQGGQAEKLIKLALQRDGSTISTVLAAAQWALETGKVEFAEEIAQKAEALDSESMQVYLLKGIIGRMKGDFVGAESSLRKAQTLKPSNAVVLNQLSLALGSQVGEEKLKQGFEFAQMATRLFPDARQPIGRECGVTLAWILSRLDKQDAAMKQLQNTLQNGPVGPDASYHAADVLHKGGRSDMATQLLKAAIENSRGVFPSKQRAEDLLRKIGGSVPAP